MVALVKGQVWDSSDISSIDSIGNHVLEETLRICQDLQQDLQKLSQEAAQIKIDVGSNAGILYNLT